MKLLTLQSVEKKLRQSTANMKPLAFELEENIDIDMLFLRLSSIHIQCAAHFLPTKNTLLPCDLDQVAPALPEIALPYFPCKQWMPLIQKTYFTRF